MTERLHWGCGPALAVGYVNSDRVQQSPVAPEHLGDILFGLPSTWARRFDLVVTHHALQMMTAGEVVDALCELRRVTRSGGWIRVSVPDLRAALDNYDAGDGGFGLFPELHTPGARLNAYLTHYQQRSYWTPDHLAGVMADAGWLNLADSAPGHTHSPFPEAVELDGRPAESLYVEAVAP